MNQNRSIMLRNQKPWLVQVSNFDNENPTNIFYLRQRYAVFQTSPFLKITIAYFWTEL